ncbi:MAG: oxygen-independent coproporphyrinogen III oxidase [Gemmatimonadetes bacterium RIFCSPLOWO2_12_FULL_68_9]|nr:MAG: oxygen-independent coproporphyrinogen III oxidase [Gemmatimonadetes bacterium RIFCSPLOWO2_12_FULL_68_9]
MELTPELLARYDRPGPRYTSYPTAVDFHDRFGPADYQRHLAAAAARDREPLAFYTHLPFCAHRCGFCGCHAIVSPHGKRVSEPYLRRLKRETEMVARLLGRRRRVTQYQWGGGTPTYLTPEQIVDLFGHFASLFQFEPGAEIAVEVDPRVTTIAHLGALSALGFNRLSAGVQDLDREVQEIIGRIQPLEQTAELVSAARRLGFAGGINVDLIYGLPGQRVESFAATARAVVALGADRVAIYSFAYVPWLKGHQRALPADRLPQRERKLELLMAARSVFLDAGYVGIGMDHFAKPGDELALALENGTLHRNFMGYTTRRAGDLLGLGVSAIGSIAGAYAQSHKKLSRYYAAVDHGTLATERGYVLSDDDRIRGEVILSLMCRFEVDLDQIAPRPSFADALRKLQQLADDGLVEIRGGRISATPLGRVFVRNVAMCFDAHLARTERRPAPTFSRTV